MKTVIPSDLHEDTLTQWRGADVAVWMYHVTHRRLALMLSRKDHSEVVYIVAVGCVHISGPFSWELANLSISTGSRDGLEESTCHVIDERANFHLICSDVAFARGPATELDRSFENFLGDTPSPPSSGKR